MNKIIILLFALLVSTNISLAEIQAETAPQTELKEEVLDVRLLTPETLKTNKPLNYNRDIQEELKFEGQDDNIRQNQRMMQNQPMMTPFGMMGGY